MAKQKKFVQNNNLAIAYYRYSSHAQNETSIALCQKIFTSKFCVSLLRRRQAKAFSGG